MDYISWARCDLQCNVVVSTPRPGGHSLPAVYGARWRVGVHTLSTYCGGQPSLLYYVNKESCPLWRERCRGERSAELRKECKNTVWFRAAEHCSGRALFWPRGVSVTAARPPAEPARCRPVSMRVLRWISQQRVVKLGCLKWGLISAT